eukprot:5342138-Amphidinium_carterae.1
MTTSAEKEPCSMNFIFYRTRNRFRTGNRTGKILRHQRKASQRQQEVIEGVRIRCDRLEQQVGMIASAASSLEQLTSLVPRNGPQVISTEMRLSHYVRWQVNPNLGLASSLFQTLGFLHSFLSCQKPQLAYPMHCLLFELLNIHTVLVNR